MSTRGTRQGDRACRGRKRHGWRLVRKERRRAWITMARPKLEHESIWIVRFSKAGWKILTAAKYVFALLIQVRAIGCAETDPPLRIELDAAEKVNRVILESIGRASTHVANSLQLEHWLNMFVDRKVKAQAIDEFVGTVQQGNLLAATESVRLRITVQNVAEVCRQVY